MAKRSVHSVRSRKTKRHSRRCIFRYKHTRKQHRKQQHSKQQHRQHGGVSDDIQTTQTVGGFPVVSITNPEETSVMVAGFQPMSVRQYKKMADDYGLDPVA